MKDTHKRSTPVLWTAIVAASLAVIVTAGVARAGEKAAKASAAARATAPAAGEEKDFAALEDLVYDERYQQAYESAVGFLKKYPAGRRAEAAEFWKCYALQRSTRDYGRAFDCYTVFLDRYPDGKWSDDARTEYAKLAKRLAEAGDPRGKAALDIMRDSPDDAEFKLSVLYALIESGDDALALDAVRDVLKTSKDPELRRQAVFVLADVEDPAVLTTLIEVAKSDPDADVRRHAIYAISNESEDPRVLDTLVSIMKSEKDPDIRRHVLYALAEVDRPDVVKILSDAALNDPDLEIRTAATYAIAEVDDPEALRALKVLVKDAASLDIRRAALYALIERDDVDIVPELRALALSKGGGSEERELRRAATYALAEVDDPAVDEVLAEIVKTSDDVEVKKAAFYALAAHGSPGARETLKIAALDTKDSELARAAVYALGDLLEEDEAGFLLEVYRKSPFEDVRLAALQTSISLGGGTSAPALGTMLETEKSAEQRRMIVWALADIENDEAVAILARVAKSDADKDVRRQAVAALGSIGSPAAKQALRDLLGGE